MQAQCDTVDDIGLHAMEDLASNLDGGDDRAQALIEEDDILQSHE